MGSISAKQGISSYFTRLSRRSLSGCWKHPKYISIRPLSGRWKHPKHVRMEHLAAAIASVLKRIERGCPPPSAMGSLTPGSLTAG